MSEAMREPRCLHSDRLLSRVEVVQLSEYFTLPRAGGSAAQRPGRVLAARTRRPFAAPRPLPEPSARPSPRRVKEKEGRGGCAETNAHGEGEVGYVETSCFRRERQGAGEGARGRRGKPLHENGLRRGLGSRSVWTKMQSRLECTRGDRMTRGGTETECPSCATPWPWS